MRKNIAAREAEKKDKSMKQKYMSDVDSANSGLGYWACEAPRLYSDLILNVLTPQLNVGLRSSHLIYSSF